MTREERIEKIRNSPTFQLILKRLDVNLYRIPDLTYSRAYEYMSISKFKELVEGDVLLRYEKESFVPHLVFVLNRNSQKYVRHMDRYYTDLNRRIEKDLEYPISISDITIVDCNNINGKEFITEISEMAKCNEYRLASLHELEFCMEIMDMFYDVKMTKELSKLTAFHPCDWGSSYQDAYNNVCYCIGYTQTRFDGVQFNPDYAKLKYDNCIQKIKEVKYGCRSTV